MSAFGDGFFGTLGVGCAVLVIAIIACIIIAVVVVQAHGFLAKLGVNSLLATAAKL